MRRGEIWEVDFPLIERENSEPYGHGPVLIVSADDYNRSAIRTVLVVVITSNLKLARAPGNVLITADKTSGLRTDSVVNVSQVLVLDKTRLLSRWGTLDRAGSDLMDLGLKLVLGLS